MPKRKSGKRSVYKLGFVNILLVALVVGLGLMMSGAFIPKENFKQGKEFAGDVITQAPQSTNNNLELKPLSFTKPKDCGFDSLQQGGCSCPVTQRYGPASDGKFYYTDMAEQKCKFVSPDKVNDECTLLKLCEQNIGACSWNAPLAGPGSDCKVPISMSGGFVGGILPPPDSRNISIGCNIWKKNLLSEPEKFWCVGKPVIYLYPENQTLVDVKLSIPGEIYISIPNYPSHGWNNINANPDGTLIYEGKTYDELYYETKVEVKKIPQNGIIIPTSILSSKLLEITGKLGLKPSEQQ